SASDLPRRWPERLWRTMTAHFSVGPPAEDVTLAPWRDPQDDPPTPRRAANARRRAGRRAPPRDGTRRVGRGGRPGCHDGPRDAARGGNVRERPVREDRLTPGVQ